MPDISITPYTYEDCDWLVSQHQRLYAQAEGFDDSFGPLVQDILRAYDADHDPNCEAGWIARAGQTRLGSIFCVRQNQRTAKLRLFLVTPEARGKGLGSRLLKHCIGFARSSGYGSMTLWTHESHKAACALYRASGWTLTSSKPVHSFGVDLIEQQWDIDLVAG